MVTWTHKPMILTRLVCQRCWENGADLKITRSFPWGLLSIFQLPWPALSPAAPAVGQHLPCCGVIVLSS